MVLMSLILFTAAIAKGKETKWRTTPALAPTDAAMSFLNSAATVICALRSAARQAVKLIIPLTILVGLSLRRRTEMNDITAIQFDREAAMFAWLADESKMQELQQQYPPGQYSARMDMVNKRVLVTPTVPPPDRGAENPGKLDVHGIAALRRIILTVIDDGYYELYESWVHRADADDERTAGEVVNNARLDFCDAVSKAITDAGTSSNRREVSDIPNQS